MGAVSLMGFGGTSAGPSAAPCQTPLANCCLGQPTRLPTANCSLERSAASKNQPERQAGKKNILNPLNLATNMVAGDGDGHWWGTLAYIYHPDRFLGDLPVHLSLELRV